MSPSRPICAGVELGGTKCICVLGTGPEDVRAEVRLPTLQPDVTLAAIAEVLSEWRRLEGGYDALGIASFGPLDLRHGSPTYGHVTASAKPGWRNIDIVGALTAGYRVPVGFDTDVNGAALAEGRWGAARGLHSFAYVTVGTGVGVGLVVDGRLVHGCNHTELGHVRVARMAGDEWPGICSYHGDCVEGIASGPAIAARTGHPASELDAGDPAWEAVAHALGQLFHTIFFTTSPQRILLGGGVGYGRPELLARIREQMMSSIRGFVDLPDLVGRLDDFLVSPGLAERAGPLGALVLALDALPARAAASAATG